MRYILGFLAFWYDFIVGDDWRVAAAVVVGLICTAVLSAANLPAWWLLPVVVIVFLSISLQSVKPKKP